MLAHRLRRAVGGGALELAIKDHATSTGASVTWPSVAAGDLAVLVDLSFADFSTPSAVTPSGFTNHVSQSGSVNLVGSRLMVSSKICVGTESGSLTGMDDDYDNKILTLFQSGVASVNSSTWNHQVTGGNPTSQNVNADESTPPVIVFGVIGRYEGLASFATASPSFDAELTVGKLRVGYKIYNETPVDHTVDGADNGDHNVLSSGYIEAS